MAELSLPDHPTHVVGIVGGAVAGSEAALLCSERGAIAIVFEEGPRAYGKIEDGLPRWHEKLRDKEFEKIDSNLTQAGVYFVPMTAIGTDVSVEQLKDELGLSALILATGASQDRPLPIAGAETYVGKGLYYQNPFVRWFNHQNDSAYEGPSFEISDGALVLGGGLASVDVCKIINLTLFGDALRARGVDVDMLTLETQGIDTVCEKNGIDPASLGIRGATLVYRRRKQDMPLAPAPANAANAAKSEALRAKIFDRVMRKYFVNLEECAMPLAALTEGDRMVGLRFARSEVVDGRVRRVEGSEFELRSPMTVGSIGSIPLPVPGVPTDGELYRFEDRATGRITDGIFGLGNALTGKGNIRDSRLNAREVGTHVLDDYLGLESSDAGEATDALHEQANARADATVGAALSGQKVSVEDLQKVAAWVEARWKAVGYDDYASWMKAHPPAR